MKLMRNSKLLLIALVLSLLFVLFFAQAAFAQEVKLSASQETGFVGETVTVKISISNALQTEGGQFDLYYGPAVLGAAVKLEPVSVSGGDFVPGFDPTNNANLALEGNKIRILWLTPEGSAKESGVICNVVFKIKEAGETTLTFSDWVIVDPLARTVGTPTSGKVTGLGETSKENAIRNAEDLIDVLPTPIDCSNSAHRTMVLKARAAVAEAKTDFGAVDSDFRNLNKLVDAEKVIAKCDAIRAAEDLIDVLPTPIDCSNSAHRTMVLNARAAVAEAKTDFGAVDSDFSNLNKLIDAEKVIAKCDAIRAADDAIYALPSVENLKLDDKSKVEQARYLVNYAKTQHGAVDSDFAYLTKLVAAENRIKELEGKKPTPPTGGAYYLLLSGSLILIAGVAVILKRRQLLA
jgi:hypothetical protein